MIIVNNYKRIDFKLIKYELTLSNSAKLSVTKDNIIMYCTIINKPPKNYSISDQ